MLQVLPTPIVPDVRNASEERSIVAWQQLYPDRWLLLAVMHEDEGEPLTGRLIAVASEDTALVPLWQELAQQGTITALVYGHVSETGPTVVAYDAP